MKAWFAILYRIKGHTDSPGTSYTHRMTAGLLETDNSSSANTVGSKIGPISQTGTRPSTSPVVARISDLESVLPPDLTNRKFDRSDLPAVLESGITFGMLVVVRLIMRTLGDYWETGRLVRLSQI